MQQVANLNFQISPAQIIAAVQLMQKDQQQAFLEDLPAAVSPEYLESIKQAREEYKAAIPAARKA
jgi:Mg/Co/Ni transporter MgtE